MRGGRKGLLTAIVGTFLALSGATLIVVAMASAIVSGTRERISRRSYPHRWVSVPGQQAYHPVVGRRFRGTSSRA